MDPIDIAAPEHAVPVITLKVLDKAIALPITGRRLLMFKTAMVHAMGIKRRADLKTMDPDAIEVDELQGVAAVDEILRDCPATADLAGTLSIEVYDLIIGQLMAILFRENAQPESDSKKK